MSEKATIKIMLHGLIARDCDAVRPPTVILKEYIRVDREVKMEDDGLDDGVIVSVEQAITLLAVVRGEVHVLSKEGLIMIGTDWRLADVKDVFKRAGKVALFYADRRGKALGSDHYLWLTNRGRMYCFATKKRAKLPTRGA